jgi:hypothetical protein
VFEFELNFAWTQNHIRSTFATLIRLWSKTVVQKCKYWRLLFAASHFRFIFSALYYFYCAEPSISDDTWLVRTVIGNWYKLAVLTSVHFRGGASETIVSLFCYLKISHWGFNWASRLPRPHNKWDPCDTSSGCCRWMRRPRDKQGSCKYIEQTSIKSYDSITVPLLAFIYLMTWFNGI